MRPQQVLEYAFYLLIAVFLLSLILGQVLGHPFLISYVESESMEPTLDTGDGFFVVPQPLAGEVAVGDVIVFESQDPAQGPFTTHRVVDVTPEGYITQGDANAFTDQDAGDPPITDGEIVGTALEFRGAVVPIPYLGTGVEAMQAGIQSFQQRIAGAVGSPLLLGQRGFALLLFGIGALLLAADQLVARQQSARHTRQRARSRRRTDVFDARTILIGFVLFIFIVAFASMSIGSGTVSLDIVSAEFQSERVDVIEQGTTETIELPVTNTGILPAVTIFEPSSGGVSVPGDPIHLQRGETAVEPVAVTAPPETGFYLRSVTGYRYLAVLPTDTIETLHAIHPWLARATISGVLAGAFALPMWLFLGSGPIRTRERKRDRGSGFLPW